MEAEPAPQLGLAAGTQPDERLGSVGGPVDVGAASAAAIRRALVEAYDRLAERLLQRLRSVGEDMDADLAELRSEMSALRRSVEDLDHRAQLRQLRGSFDELRADVAALRQAVAEASGATSATGGGATPPPTGSATDAGTALLDELASLREDLTAEITALRRRIALRGAPTGTELSDEAIARIADAVALRLSGPARRRR